MKFDVLTLFPEIIDTYCNYSILKRARENNLIEVNAINIRDYSLSKHKKVDDTIFGGSSGMLLMCEPCINAFESIRKRAKYKTIILSPDGKQFNQNIAKELTEYEQIILLCGHYEGFDERISILTEAEHLSIGDYILTGGELGALVIIDSISRLLDGVLGKRESYINDSFSEPLLEHPQYTKPRSFRGLNVPEVLLNGNHMEINKWRRTMSIIKTKEKRPDLYEKFLSQELSDFDKEIIRNIDI